MAVLLERDDFFAVYGEPVDMSTMKSMHDTAMKLSKLFYSCAARASRPDGARTAGSKTASASWSRAASSTASFIFLIIQSYMAMISLSSALSASTALLRNALAQHHPRTQRVYRKTCKPNGSPSHNTNFTYRK